MKDSFIKEKILGGKRKSECDEIIDKSLLSILEYHLQILAVSFYYIYTNQSASLNDIAEFVQQRLEAPGLSKSERIKLINQIIELLHDIMKQGHELEKKRGIRICRV